MRRRWLGPAAALAWLAALGLACAEGAVRRVGPADPSLATCETLESRDCGPEDPPVCALARLDMACPDAPCRDVLVWRDHANACAACADFQVEGWKPGPCPDDAG